MFIDLWTFVNPVIRTLVYIAVLTSIGTILFSFHFKNYFNGEISIYCNRLLNKMSRFGLVFCFLYFFSVVGNLGGEFFSIFDFSLIHLSTETLSGKSAMLQIIAFSILLFSNISHSTFFNFLKVISIVLLLWSFVIVGHSLSNGLITQALVIIHLLCISFWVGSFLPLRFMCKINNFKLLSSVTSKFGYYATFYIVVLIIAGVLFSFILIGNLDSLLSTTYGNVLILKLLFVLSMLSLGAFNKFRLVPNIEVDYNKGKHKLKTSIEVEMFFALLIFILTSILTTSLPTPIGV